MEITDAAVSETSFQNQQKLAVSLLLTSIDLFIYLFVYIKVYFLNLRAVDLDCPVHNRIGHSFTSS